MIVCGAICSTTKMILLKKIFSVVLRVVGCCFLFK